MKQMSSQLPDKQISNSQIRDSSSKIIFGEPVLCAQFLRGYVNIPIIKDVQPEDIEDVSDRYVHMFVEERNSDVVKKVRLKEDETPFYVISLIEHKSHVDYNVLMQILRYMVFIWEDYEKEQEKKHPGISKTKGFKYPPVLPIIYYDGPSEWNAGIELKDRIFLSDVFESYIPNFKCILVQLQTYSNEELKERKDELSIIMMISKLQKAADFAKICKDVDAGYLNEVTSKSPEYLLDIIAQIIEILLLKVNVPREEAEAFAGQVKERPMGELFANFEAYDVQATRRVARQIGLEEDLIRSIRMMKEAGVSREVTKQQLIKQYELSAEEAEEKLKQHW